MEWIFKDKIQHEGVELEERTCSECGTTVTTLPWELYQYCPWCGEMMESRTSLKESLIYEVHEWYHKDLMPNLANNIEKEFKELADFDEEELKKYMEEKGISIDDISKRLSLVLKQTLMELSDSVVKKGENDG